MTRQGTSKKEKYLLIHRRCNSSVMTSTLLSQQEDDDEVELIFVIPLNLKADDCDKNMQDAFQSSLVKELNPTWKSESQCLQLKPGKTSVFVLQQFSGAAFEHLKKYKCVIIGPRCLNHCLMRDEAIPIVPYPTFTDAMKDLVITSSGGGVEAKKEIKERVELMAGTYIKNFSEKTTHVVVCSVSSTKYEKALELGIPVRTHEWVNAVWTKSLNEYILATDEIFNHYKCPPFLNLNVCSSGITTREQERLRNVVTKHGGTFDGAFSQKINVLVVKQPKGEKYKYAQQWDVPCVEPKWIYDSVQNGHALPTKSYEVKGGRAASSPSDTDASVTFSANVSTIQFDQRTHIDETVLNSSVSSVASFCPTSKNKTPAPKQTSVKTPVKVCPPPWPNPGELKHLLSEVNLSQAKKAGSFLDGCGVYLLGWNSDEEECLRKILKCSGAARFSDLSDRVSHVLVGNLEKPFLRTIRALPHKPYVVNIKWLIQSVTEKAPASEEPFNCLPSEKLDTTEAPSPLSKKGMALLQNFSPHKPLAAQNHPLENNQNSPSPNKDDQLLAKYISADSSSICMPPPPVPSPKKQASHPAIKPKTAETSDVETQEDSLKFVIVGLPEASASYAEKDLIQKYGGEVVPKSYKGVPDFAIVPLTGFTLRQTATEIVTILWLQACIEQQGLVPVEYYHQPVVLDVSKKPLQGCVVSLSGYSGKERQFILELASALGATCQEVFARTTKVDAKASSHLVCKTDEKTKKFNAAIKWLRPAVYHSWLFACASSGSYVPECGHLVDPQQVVKPIDSLNISTASFINNSTTHNKIEPSTVTALKKVASGTTPERSAIPPELMKQVDHILNYEPSPNRHAVKTPPVPIGLSDNPTPGESKRIQRWLNKLPEQLPASHSRRDSTPMHELMKNVLRANTVTTPEMLGEVPLQSNHIEDIPESATAMAQAGKKETDSITTDPLSTPTHSSSFTSRQLFKPDVNSSSLCAGPLDKLKRLIATPETAEDSTSSKSASLNHLRVASNPHKSIIHDPLKDGSQPYAIKWEDPANLKRFTSEESSSADVGSRRNEQPVKRKSSENAENTPEPKRSHHENTKEVSKSESIGKVYHHENTKEVSKSESIGKVYKFCMSAVDTKGPYVSIIQKLGGELINTQSYDPTATHLLLVKAPQRSEKLLAFIAAGKWVLHISYLMNSEKKGRFLPEEDYEWGNPNNHLLGQLKPNTLEEALAKAVYRWRIIIAETHCGGAFKDFTCKIFSDKAAAFARLVAAGGGKVLAEESQETPSICIVQLSTHRDVLHEFAMKGIPCVPPTFLYDHLTLHPIPSPESKTLEEYKKLRSQYETNL
ncbi:DNA topoisomerase 2-binding protein 1-A [Frankliniella fusca]|uniref:DNA topoisomerase 2-binding protein 1-A n=1 Tax=Frankliniella fusca TaxID=407009 RepID=A0AAE1HZD5_9NEOP|nr:DNA topoisomerase 2-binding protein 1-A [Frankliniella fusca]